MTWHHLLFSWEGEREDVYGGSGVPDEGNDKQIAHTNDGTPDEEDDDGGDDQRQQQDRYTQGLLLVRSF